MSTILSSSTSSSSLCLDINDIISIAKLPCHKNLKIYDKSGNSIKINSIIGACYSNVIKNFCQVTNDLTDGLTFVNCCYNEIIFFSRFLNEKIKINLINISIAVNVACKFEIKLLKDKCLKFLTTSNNLCYIKDLLIFHDELFESSYYKEIISSNISLIKNFLSSEFTEMNDADLQNAPWIYCMFYWIPGNEGIKLIQKWINLDKSRENSISLPILYKYLDLSTLPSDIINQIQFKTNPNLYKSSNKINNDNKKNFNEHEISQNTKDIKNIQKLTNKTHYLKEDTSCTTEFVHIPMNEEEREKQNIIYLNNAKSKVSKWVDNAQFSQAIESTSYIEEEYNKDEIDHFHTILEEISSLNLESSEVYKRFCKCTLPPSIKFKLTVQWVEKNPQCRIRTLYSVWKMMVNKRILIPENDLRKLLIYNQTFLKFVKNYEIFATKIYDKFFS